ncbi:MAG: hypothetical protein JWN46_3029 [Acidimicrobiales bacterium]|nr:hypothetical protein [Acidimicrobiales bacterium]
MVDVELVDVKGQMGNDPVDATIEGVQELLAAGQMAAAFESASDALAGARVGSIAASRLRLTLASMLVLTGHPIEAIELADATLLEAALPAGLFAGADLVRLLGVIALDDVPRVRDVAEDILAGHHRPADDAALAAALTALAFAAWDGGGVSDALGFLRAAVRRAEVATLDGLRVFPQLRLAAALTSLGEDGEANRVLDRAAQEVGRTGDLLWAAGPPIGRAALYLACGALDDAVAAATGGLAVAEELGTRYFTPDGELVLTSAALLRGDLLGAGRHLARLRSVIPTRASSGGDVVTWLDMRLAEANGDVERTRRDLDMLQASLPVHCRLFVEEPAAPAWLTRTALRLGEHTVAERLVRRVEALAVTNPRWLSVAAASDHARGLLERDVDRVDRAAAGHRRAWARGSAWEDAGHLLVARGDRSDARERFTLAGGAYHEAGASRDEARISRRADAAARRVGRTCRPVSGWGSLTETERRVAGVVAEGLTNAGAAQRLYLSRHTVDFHLRQIFRKLAIRSRVELVRLVLQADDH